MKRLFLLGLATILGAGALSAQTGYPFIIRVQQPDSVATIGNGGGVTLNAAIGSSTTVNVTLTYIGFGQVALATGPEVFGSSAFTLENVSTIPTNMTNGSTFSFTVRFTPTRGAAVSAQVNLPYTETIPPVTPTGSPTINHGITNITFAGTAPDLVVSYFFPDDQNFIQLPNGGRITFPATAVNTANTVTLSIANRGSGAGSIDSLAVSGTGFQSLGLPLLPLTL